MSNCKANTTPLATSKVSVTRRSGEPNLPARELFLEEEPPGEGGDLRRFFCFFVFFVVRVVEVEVERERHRFRQKTKSSPPQEPPHLETPEASAIPPRAAAPAAKVPIGTTRDMASRLEEAGRLRARDDDDEANDELMIVEGRRSGGILAPLRTSALARNLLPVPGGGGIALFVSWWGRREPLKGRERVLRGRGRKAVSFFFFFSALARKFSESRPVFPFLLLLRSFPV